METCVTVKLLYDGLIDRMCITHLLRDCRNRRQKPRL